MTWQLKLVPVDRHMDQAPLPLDDKRSVCPSPSKSPIRICETTCWSADGHGLGVQVVAIVAAGPPQFPEPVANKVLFAAVRDE